MSDEGDSDAPTAVQVPLDAHATTMGAPRDATPRFVPGAPHSGGLARSGQRLGHFELIELLGAGGMGAVWKARDVSLDRHVAVKLLQPGVDPTILERFRREARAQARLNHPHVVQIFFVGDEAGQPYFAMEWVEGESLGDRVAGGPIPWVEALDACRQACLGLAHASGRGLVHRDVKPANIMVGRDGVAKVADFGIAKPNGVLEPDVIDGQDADAPGDLTQTGTFVGTPRYAAPEQIRGEVVDERADIYALGGTLFHLLAGKAAFGHASTFELMRSQLVDEVPWDELPDSTPRRVRELLQRMLEKEPERRFASYGELLDAMARALPRNLPPAELPARLAAVAIDVGPVPMVLLLLDNPWLNAQPVFTLVEPLYLLLPLMVWGQTLGQRLTAIQVVDRHGERPGIATLFARVLIATGGCVAFDLLADSYAEMVVFGAYYGAFLLTGLFTSGHRLPPDLLTGTRTVHDVEPGSAAS